MRITSNSIPLGGRKWLRSGSGSTGMSRGESLSIEHTCNEE
jgi:hypothetical protein